MNLKSDEYYMAQALREAERGLYTAQPNPRVGCVLVRDKRVLAKGFHLQTGSGHAEANALKLAGSAAKGSTVYVTLEPCSFTGRTPSCAQALIQAGVSRVVFAMQDPHPKNQGLGLQKLTAAGIAVDGPVLELAAKLLNIGHIKKYVQGLPFVRLKLAMSLDGKTALANGASQWVTGPAARLDVQKLRARSSAIITGVQTVINDDPALTIRSDELDDEFSVLASEIPRKIVVLDSNARIPPKARLLRNQNTLLVTLKEQSAIKVNTLVVADDGQGKINLSALLRALAQLECNEVLFECGPTLAGNLVNQALVDELVIYIAPKLLGDKARPLLYLDEFVTMDQVPEFAIHEVRTVGHDIRITAKIGQGLVL